MGSGLFCISIPHIPKSGLTQTGILCNLLEMIFRPLSTAALVMSALLLCSCSMMQQQGQQNTENEQQEATEAQQKPPLYLGSVHQVYPERQFALLRIIGPMPKEGAVLISHPFDGTADRIGNLRVASGQHSRNGIIAADIRSGVVMKGDRIFQYRNIIGDDAEATEQDGGDSPVFEGLEQDVEMPAESLQDDSQDYGVSRFNAAGRAKQETHPEESAIIDPTPQDPAPLPPATDNTPFNEPPAPINTMSPGIMDIPDTIDGWDNM